MKYDVRYSLKNNRHYSDAIAERYTNGKSCTVTFSLTGNIKLIRVYPSNTNHDLMSEIVGTLQG